MIRRIAPILWLMAAAVIIGASIGLSARADTDPGTNPVTAPTATTGVPR